MSKRKANTEEKLYPDGDYEFTVCGGAKNRGGKNYYPALLRLYMSKRDALNLLQNLAHQLNNREESKKDDQAYGEFVFSGQLNRLPDDE